MTSSPSGDAGERRVSTHPVLGELPGARLVEITVDQRPLLAREGEVLAAALLAHGLVTARTMPQGQEPRGLFCAVGRCPDCAMTVDGEPNARACQVRVREGMVVETQHGLGQWGGGTG